MAEIGEIVYKSELANGGLICQFTKTATGYLREQILATGLVMQGECTEEEYQEFLIRVKHFDAVSASSKQGQSQKKKPFKE